MARKEKIGKGLQDTGTWGGVGEGADFAKLQMGFPRAGSLFRGLSVSHLCAEPLQSCSTPCNSMDCSLPGSSVHGILQASILEWVSRPFSRGFSHPRDRPRVSLCLLHCRRVLYH